MHLAIDELKIKAKKLLKTILVLDSSRADIQLMACQRIVAKKLGFDDFNHARQLLTAKVKVATSADFGSMWYDASCIKYTNQWFSTYSEALEIHQHNHYYLLPYKRQFLLVTEAFMFSLGLTEHELEPLGQAGGDLISCYASEVWDKLAQLRIRTAIDVDKLASGVIKES